MTTDTKETIAAALHGREYGRDCIPSDVQKRAKDAGLLIVCGASDDLVEFYGAWRDEAGAYNGTTVLVDGKGILPEWENIESEEASEEFHDRKPLARKIEAIWCPKDDSGKVWASWAYKTSIKHITFDIMEDGEIYCRGIVFDISDLANAE